MNKKLLLLSTLALLTLGQQARSQSLTQSGEHGLTFTASYSSISKETSINKQPLSTPASSELTVGLGYRRFLADNVSFALNVGLVHSDNIIGQSTTGTWMHNKITGLSISPEVSYYIPLTDNLYWVFTLYGAYEFGEYTEDLSDGSEIEADYRGYGFGFAPLGIEFQATDNISLTLSVGAYTFAHAKVEASGINIETSADQWKLNTASLSVNIRL